MSRRIRISREQKIRTPREQKIRISRERKIRMTRMQRTRTIRDRMTKMHQAHPDPDRIQKPPGYQIPVTMETAAVQMARM